MALSVYTDVFLPTTSFAKLIRKVDNADTAKKLFEELGILPTSVQCECGIRGKTFIKKNICGVKAGFLWRCSICKRRFNPLKNTFFEKSRVDYLKIFELTVHWFFRVPVAISQEDMSCGPCTYADWKSYCREVCQIATERKRKPIGGPGHWVEIDETHLFRRKYNRGHRILGESVWIFGGVDRETKERFIMRVPNRKKRTLWPIIRKNVAPGSILVTDDFSTYTGIGNHPQMRLAAHEVVVHKYSFVNPLFREVFTNNVECIWGKLKRLVKRSGTNEAIDSYICEFMYRTNLDREFGKSNSGPKLQRFFQDVKRVYPGPNKIGWKL